MYRVTSFIIGLAILFLTGYLFVTQSAYWFFPAVIGVWLVLDCISKVLGNKTTLDLLIKRKQKKAITLYVWLVIFGILIEVIGRIFFEWWTYPKLSPFMHLMMFPFYPFIFISFRELYHIVLKVIRNIYLSYVITQVLAIIIWEWPNVYSKDWIYNIPFIKTEIFSLNVFVIVSWIILIFGTNFIYDKNRV